MSSPLQGSPWKERGSRVFEQSEEGPVLGSSRLGQSLLCEHVSMLVNMCLSPGCSTSDPASRYSIWESSQGWAECVGLCT